MEKRSRSAILNNKSKLENISAPKLRPLLLKHKIFTNSMLDDICNNSRDMFDELVTRGPDAFGRFIKVLKESGYIKEAEILDSDAPKISKGPCYKIKSEPLGMCLIINNVNFWDGEVRLGSNVDAENLFKIFEKIGFFVVLESNLTAKEINMKLFEFSKDHKWGLVDSCIVIILSHGRNIDNLDVICGIDGEYIPKMEIIEMFSNSNSANLISKPKIFIFQACRGSDEDAGAYSYESTDASKVIMPNATSKIKLSTLSDILVVHSALPNHKSYRDHEKGSWLCQDLVHVLSEDYLNHDFETMLKTVTRKIQNRLSVEGKKKQGIHLEPINLRADIIFNRNLAYEYFKE